MSEPAAGSLAPEPSTPPAPGNSEGAPPGSLRPRPRIPDHELLYPIGRGAYGDVWLARNVFGSLRAVKVLYRQDFGESQPFDREFKGIEKFEPVSRAHRSLIDILQIGRNDADGYFYYVMELADDAGGAEARSSKLEGREGPTPELRTPGSELRAYSPRTLRHELKSRGRLPLDECLQLGLSLTGALEHLHQHGLVHRDVKPSNIIFVNGQPKLADIGLVAGVDEARSFVGTEGFIPPEGPGKPQADLYSLGKALYEAAMGRTRLDFPSLPADWDTLPAERQSQLMEFNEVLVKACDGDPHQRYQTAAEMREDLKLLEEGKSVRKKRAWAQRRSTMVKAAAVVAAIGAVAALAYQAFRPTRTTTVPPTAASAKPSVFVLPIRNPNGYSSYDSANDIRNRVTDAFIDSLGCLFSGGRVGPRKSAWVWEDEAELVKRVRQNFGMSHVLTGRMVGTNDQWDLTVNFTRTGDSTPLWTEQASGSTDDLPRLEMAVVERVAGSLGLTVSATRRQQVGQLLTNNLAAYRLCLSGWKAYFRFNQAGFAEATECFDEALLLDNKDLDAELGALATMREQTGHRKHSEVYPDVRARALRILNLDDTHRMARNYLAATQLLYDWQWDESIPALFATYPPDDFLTYSHPSASILSLRSHFVRVFPVFRGYPGNSSVTSSPGRLASRAPRRHAHLMT